MVCALPTELLSHKSYNQEKVKNYDPNEDQFYHILFLYLISIYSILTNHYVLINGFGGRARTYDILINSQMLLPTELHRNKSSHKIYEPSNKTPIPPKGVRTIRLTSKLTYIEPRLNLSSHLTDNL